MEPKMNEEIDENFNIGLTHGHVSKCKWTNLHINYIIFSVYLFKNIYNYTYEPIYTLII